MFKFLLQLILQFVLFVIVSVFLLFRNDGEGAKWVSHKTPQVLEAIDRYTLPLHKDYLVKSVQEVINGSKSLQIPEMPIEFKSPVESVAETNTEEKSIDAATIGQLYSAMEASGILPTEGRITAWVPVHETNVLTGSSNMTDTDRKVAGEKYLAQMYQEVAGNTSHEAPVVKVEGRRLFGQIRGQQFDGSYIELTIQMEVNSGHLSVFVRQPLPEFVRSNWLASLKKLTQSSPKSEFGVSLKGVRPGRLNPQEQEKIIDACFEKLHAKKIEVIGQDALLVSGYTPLLPGGVRIGKEKINLQILGRYYGVDRQTHFVIGYPLVIQET